MSPSTFFYILDGISENVKKNSNFLSFISPAEKLTVTLRFLATRMSFRTLSFSFWIAHNTIGQVIYETCEVIWEVFVKKQMPYPTIQMHGRAADEFKRKWDFPNCVGCVDGKHIRINVLPTQGRCFLTINNFSPPTCWQLWTQVTNLL